MKVLRLFGAAALLWFLGCKPVNPNPANAEIVTADLPRFWAAFDQGIDGDLSGAFQNGYIQGGSSGLTGFMKKIKSADKLAENVQRTRRYHESVRSNVLALGDDDGTSDQIRANFQRAKELYPEAVFPPIYLLMGGFASGGSTSEDGILIGAEFVTRSPTSPLDELTAREAGAVSFTSSLPIIASHEQVHISQVRHSSIASRGAANLLEASLLEGMADYLGELASSGNINSTVYAYGEAHEQELWEQFQAEMDGTDLSQWLYNRGTDPVRPGDLGYFIGYRITQSFVLKTGDVHDAYAKLVSMSDAHQILEASGYQGAPPAQ